MEILFVLIPLSAVLIAIAVAALVWAVKDGQFEAPDDPGRLLRDDEPPPPAAK
jgi:cbb3-type cytochrome oxidase maturation protein